MIEVPKFTLYGQGNPEVEETIQPVLGLRGWGDLRKEEKEVALQHLENSGWLDRDQEILSTISRLNHEFLRRCPGARLHRIKPKRNEYGRYNNDELEAAAGLDFKNIFVGEKSEALVLRMLSVLAECLIDHQELQWAGNAENDEKREENIKNAFKRFDPFSNCLNHIFDQFSVNVQVTRSGIFPKQDANISKNIYEPTMKILADPKWRSVSADLGQMFSDYGNKEYAEVITKAHRAVQRFLQILVGSEGKSGKGEIGRLFATAKREGVLPVDRFTEPLIGVIQGFLVSERATNSTAKPAIRDATEKDAMLVMNVVMVLFQHCLSNEA